ncbi:MAG: CoA-binding protein [Planctomycetes bacterium]|nr:CoA-binding protein [Planctomycetota bacterium]
MKNIAIVGASANPEKFGNKAVRAYRQRGWNVYPINPKEATIEGLKAFKSLAEITEPLDEVSLYLPPPAVPAVLREIAAKGVKRVWFNPGTESEAALTLAEELGLEAIVACSIVGVGADPGTL